MEVHYRLESDYKTGLRRREHNEPARSRSSLAPDGKRVVVSTLPETPADGEKGTVHVTVLDNFFDEVRRRISPGGK